MSSGDLKPETSYQAVVGQVIVKMRKALSIEQCELAKKVGITQSTWSRIERGESSFSIGQLFDAANSLRVNSSTILLETEKAVSELRTQGVIVRNVKPKGNKDTNGAALIGAVALGALVGAAIAKSTD
jgi:transcriptional regulator with XRE-family HTH domain